MTLGLGIGGAEYPGEPAPADDLADERTEAHEAELHPGLPPQTHVEDAEVTVPIAPARCGQDRADPAIPARVARRAALGEQRPERRMVQGPQGGKLELEEVELGGIPVNGDDLAGAIEHGEQGDVPSRGHHEDPIPGREGEPLPVDPVILPDAAVQDPRAHGREPRPDPPSIDQPSSDLPPSSIHRLAASTGALWVAFAWGAAEASLFFLVPDLWIVFVALFAPWRTVKALLATIVGALVGATVLWWLAPIWPGLGDAIAALPGIRPADLARAASDLAGQGLGAFLGGPIQGLPVKVYIHQAALLGEPLPGVLAMVALNRIERVGLSALVAAILGTVFRGSIRRHPSATLAGYVVLITAIYGAYFSLR